MNKNISKQEWLLLHSFILSRHQISVTRNEIMSSWPADGFEAASRQ
jgi:hypothetical protein